MYFDVDIQRKLRNLADVFCRALRTVCNIHTDVSFLFPLSPRRLSKVGLLVAGCEMHLVIESHKGQRKSNSVRYLKYYCMKCSKRVRMVRKAKTAEQI